MYGFHVYTWPMRVHTKGLRKCISGAISACYVSAYCFPCCSIRSSYVGVWLNICQSSLRLWRKQPTHKAELTISHVFMVLKRHRESHIEHVYFIDMPTSLSTYTCAASDGTQVKHTAGMLSQSSCCRIQICLFFFVMLLKDVESACCVWPVFPHWLLRSVGRSQSVRFLQPRIW